MIKNICFDLDGVLFAPTCFKDFKAKISTLTPYAEKIDEIFHGSKMDDFKRGKVSEPDFWHYADTELGLTLGIKGYFDLLKDSYILEPEVVELITALKKKDKIISICTNNFPTRIQALNAATNFLELIDVPILSYQIGSLKPEKQIYEALIDRSGCSANEIFYSDDNEQKLKGARDLGISCVVVHDLTVLFETIRKIT